LTVNSTLSATQYILYQANQAAVQAAARETHNALSGPHNDFNFVQSPHVLFERDSNLLEALSFASRVILI
jgi:hypothetical protein